MTRAKMYSKRGENSRGRDQKQGVSRGTSRWRQDFLLKNTLFNMRECLRLKNPLSQTEYTLLRVSRHCDLSRLGALEHSSSSVFHVERVVQNSVVGCSTWNAMQLCRTLLVSRETLMDGKSRRNSRLC